MKNLSKLVFSIIILLLVSSCSRSFHRWNADRQGDIQEAYKVQNADKRLQDLHWFENQYQQIQAYTIQYNSETDLERQRAIKNILNREIGSYNSRMRSYDRSMWANNDLPEKISMID